MQLREVLGEAFEGFKTLLGRDWWSNIFRGVALCSLLAAITVYYQQKAFIDCIASYNDAQAATGQYRAAAVQENFDAMDQMIKDVVNAKKPGDTRKALDSYLKAREAADTKRATNPPPAPPSERCD